MAWTTIAGEARAEPKRYVVDYHAGRECPVLQDFVAEVSRRSTNAIYDPTSTSAERVVVRAEVRDGEAVGEVGVGSEAPRRVSGLTCSALIEGLDLVVAISLDPYLLSPKPQPPPKPKSHPPPQPQPRVVAAPVDASATMTAMVRAVGGAAPQTIIGGALAASLAPWGKRAPWLFLTLEHGQTGTFDVASGAARFRLSTVGFAGCLDGWNAQAGKLSACAGIDAGVLGAEGLAVGQITAAHSVSRPWLDMVVLGRSSWNLVGPVWLEVDAGIGYAVTHRAFVFENPRETVYDPSGVVWRGGAGLGLSVW